MSKIRQKGFSAVCEACQLALTGSRQEIEAHFAGHRHHVPIPDKKRKRRPSGPVFNRDRGTGTPLQKGLHDR